MSLTRGYAAGLLTFEYPNTLSKVRETYLVNYLEQQVVSDILKTKALITANLMALPQIAKEANKESFDLFKQSVELILPSSKKSDKMKEMTKDDRIKIRESLKLANEQLKNKLSKQKPKKIRNN